MTIDHCLILSAGLGTRMGEIGKNLPKPLWPIFDKKMLYLQILFARNLGCKNIFVNIHHCFKDIEREVSEWDFDNVHLIFEEKLLGSGGAVHNLSNHKLVKGKGKLLTLNVDIFYFFSIDYIKEGLSKLVDYPVVLFSIQFDDKNGVYNGLVINENKLLKEISPKNTTNKNVITYSGVSLINIDKLNYQAGESSYFGTVAAYKEIDVYTIHPKKSECWDFGTLPQFYHNHYKLLKCTDSKMHKFCRDNGSIDKNLLGENSYKGPTDLINLSGINFETHKNVKAIILDMEKKRDLDKPGIYFNNQVDKVSA
jgi:NDP-sugar pyrophosphorylase family protein